MFILRRKNFVKALPPEKLHRFPISSMVRLVDEQAEIDVQFPDRGIERFGQLLDGRYRPVEQQLADAVEQGVPKGLENMR